MGFWLRLRSASDKQSSSLSEVEGTAYEAEDSGIVLASASLSQRQWLLNQRSTIQLPERSRRDGVRSGRCSWSFGYFDFAQPAMMVVQLLQD